MEGITMAILFNYLFQVPMYLVCLVGIIIALVRWKKHPRVSLFALLGLGLWLLVSLVFTAVSAWMPFWMQSQEIPISQYSLINGVANILRTLLGTGSFILLLIAIFGWRGESMQAVNDKSGD